MVGWSDWSQGARLLSLDELEFEFEADPDAVDANAPVEVLCDSFPVVRRLFEFFFLGIMGDGGGVGTIISNYSEFQKLDWESGVGIA